MATMATVASNNPTIVMPSCVSYAFPSQLIVAAISNDGWQPDREIVGCISEIVGNPGDIGVSFSLEDLHKPNPQQIQKVFEWLAELLMNTTRETVEPAMRAAAEDVCGEHMEVVPADTRNLMGFYVSLRRLLIEVHHLLSIASSARLT